MRTGICVGFAWHSGRGMVGMAGCIIYMLLMISLWFRKQFLMISYDSIMHAIRSCRHCCCSCCCCNCCCCLCLYLCCCYCCVYVIKIAMHTHWRLETADRQTGGRTWSDVWLLLLLHWADCKPLAPCPSPLSPLPLFAFQPLPHINMLIKIMLPSVGRQRKKPSKCLRIASHAHTHTQPHTLPRNMVPWRRALSPFCIYTPRSTPFKRQHSPCPASLHDVTYTQRRTQPEQESSSSSKPERAECKQAQVWWLPLWEMPTGSSAPPPSSPSPPPPLLLYWK